MQYVTYYNNLGIPVMSFQQHNTCVLELDLRSYCVLKQEEQMELDITFPPRPTVVESGGGGTGKGPSQAEAAEAKQFKEDVLLQMATLQKEVTALQSTIKTMEITQTNTLELTTQVTDRFNGNILPSNGSTAHAIGNIPRLGDNHALVN